MSITQERIYKMIDDARKKKKRVKEQHGLQWLLDNFEPIKLAIWMQHQNQTSTDPALHSLISGELFGALQSRKAFINLYTNKKFYRIEDFSYALWKLLKRTLALKPLVGIDCRRLRMNNVKDMSRSMSRYLINREARRGDSVIAMVARTQRIQPSDDVIKKLTAKLLPPSLVPDIIKIERHVGLEKSTNRTSMRVRWDLSKDENGKQKLTIKQDNW